MYIKVLSKDSAANFSNSLNSGDWVVLYYAEWCGHCKTMKPEWNKFISNMKSNKRLNIADVNSDYIHDLKHKPTIDGFPTIKMYNNGNEVAKFDGERVSDHIGKFAMSNSSTTKTNSIYNILSKKKSYSLFNKDNDNDKDKDNNKDNNDTQPQLFNVMPLPPATAPPVMPIHSSQTAPPIFFPKNVLNTMRKHSMPTPEQFDTLNNQKLHSDEPQLPEPCESLLDYETCKLNSNCYYKKGKCNTKQHKKIHSIQHRQIPLQLLSQSNTQSLQNTTHSKKIHSNTKKTSGLLNLPMEPKHKLTEQKTTKTKSLKHKSLKHKSLKHKSLNHKSLILKPKHHTQHPTKQHIETKKNIHSKIHPKHNITDGIKIVFNKLIKSFGKISSEANKDSEILRKASKKI